jgi:hypothetical protein
VQGTLERADRSDDRRDAVGPGRCDHARGEGRRVHPAIADGDEIGVEACGSAFVGSAEDHAQRVGGLTELLVGFDRGQSLAPPCPCRREDGDGPREVAVVERVRRPKVRHGRAQRIHSIVRLERVAHRPEPAPRAGTTASQRASDVGLVAIPEEPAHGFERDAPRQRLDVVPGEDESPALSVDVAQARVGDDDAFEAARASIAVFAGCLRSTPQAGSPTSSSSARRDTWCALARATRARESARRSRRSRCSSRCSPRVAGSPRGWSPLSASLSLGRGATVTGQVVRPPSPPSRQSSCTARRASLLCNPRPELRPIL